MKSPGLNSPVPDAFFLQPCLELAPQLLGKRLWRRQGKVELLAEIVEVEAYLGERDPASHAFRKTERSSVMFERGGACYVYLSYGMNYCMNVVTGKEGVGEAVLIRAAAPIGALDRFYKNRGLDRSKPARLLMNGPGKLTQALGIDLKFNRTRYGEGDLAIVEGERSYSKADIGRGRRIGISKATEWDYRFWVKGSPWLSRKET
ncbi:DNA-3-methyladenine glycosylase [bacterium]|nr:DNA-3-methyladenine glycosylase [bacterium]